MDYSEKKGPSREASESKREIRLWDNAKDRRRYNDMATLFSIIKTINMVENAYARNSIKAEEYTPACFQLLSQYKTTLSALQGDGTVSDVKSFMKQYHMDCPHAEERIREGVPATTLHRTGADDNEGLIIAEIVQYLITAMDALKLEYSAADQIQPLINDIMGSYNKLTTLPANFEGTVRIRDWLLKLNGMAAVDQLSNDELRQLSHDLESSYNAFHRHLKSQNKGK